MLFTHPLPNSITPNFAARPLLSELVHAELSYLQIMPLVNLEFALRCQSVAPNAWLRKQYLSHLIITDIQKYQNA
jgi:hypothetical protein